MKRFFDIAVSLALVAVFGPVMLIIAFLVKRKLGSPVIFTQERPGLHGKAFQIYKFRSMTNAKDAEGNLLPDSLRLTPFGKLLRRYSLDELPEFFNVIKGDMSLVGPRPLHTKYLERYTAQQARRHEVRPGITGWAQINGRNLLSWQDKFTYDVWYVDNGSMWLDIKILWVTLVKVLQREGISADDHVTMPEYMGQEKIPGPSKGKTISQR